MMKIYTKRGIALAIDDLSYGIFIAALIYLIPFFQKNDLLFILYYILQYF